MGYFLTSALIPWLQNTCQKFVKELGYAIWIYSDIKTFHKMSSRHTNK